jgi:nucleoid-associated protein YgaU
MASKGLGKLTFKGDKPKKKRRERQAAADDDDDDDFDLPADLSADPLPGEGKLTTSGVVVMGASTDFASQLSVGDSLLVTVSDRFRNTQTDEARAVNMVLGRTSLNIEAPFTCDVTVPTAFLILKKAPDVEALRAKRREEKRRQRQLEEEAQLVTYKRLKQGSGTWKTWETVTERVAAGTSREEMLSRRVNEKVRSVPGLRLSFHGPPRSMPCIAC